jgi:hypothetical protein
MRRRNLHGLAGSPQQHSNQAEALASEITWPIGETTTALKRGDCKSAAQMLKKAHVIQGGIEAHIQNADRSLKFREELLDIFESDLDAAESKFRDACLVKKARALSGSPRRRK